MEQDENIGPALAALIPECRRAQDAKRDNPVNPFALRSATAFCGPVRPAVGGRRWTRQTDAEPNTALKWLDAMSDVLADFLR